MDLAQFGLIRRPFRATPDLESYYPTATHERALDTLRSAFRARDGLALVDGESGTGKTLIVRKFLDGLALDTAPVFVPAARFGTPADLYQAILFDHGTDYRGLKEQELRLAVTDQLMKAVTTGEPVVLVLDEAQALRTEVLEELRLLGNIETPTAKAAFIVLVAQLGLRERLAKPKLQSLAQRLVHRSRLEPLPREEAAHYVWHQLERAGGRPTELISDEALNLLTAHTRGIPRLLNQAASLAMTLASTTEATTVDTEAIWEALLQLGLVTEPVDEPLPLPETAPKKPDPRPGKPRVTRRKAA